MLITGRLSERYGAGTMLAIGMAVTMVASVGQIFAPSGSAVIALMCLTAIGQSVAWPNVSSLISRTADPHRQGQILGLNNAVGASARVVGPFCAGLGFSGVSIHAPFIQAALLVAPAIWLSLAAAKMLGEREQPALPPDSERRRS
jgi:MFS family permease